MCARCYFLTALLFALTSTSIAQQWYSVQTNHLIAYSEGNDHGARDGAQRGEQLIAIYEQIFHRRDINLAAPLRIIDTRTAESSGRSFSNVAFIRTPAANYITVDPAKPGSWSRAARSIGELALEDNYPRAQPWFDSGLASYLAGVRFVGDQMELGAPPSGLILPAAGDWIPLVKLFEIDDFSKLSASQRENVEAESWAFARWLIDNSRLAQAGAYLGAVQLRGAPPDKALIDAFSMSPNELDTAVRDSLAKITTIKMPAPRVEGSLFTSQKVSVADMHVMQASMSLYGPDADRTLNELVSFMRQNQDNAAVHRALAWSFLLRNDLDNAVEHIRRALALDDSDASMHYLYARWVNQGDESKIRIQSAEPRMSTELRAALKRNPNYAAALELLGLAELSSEDIKPAVAHLERASELSPRSSHYYLNLARAYEANGNLDAARRLVTYARAGGDPVVSAEATAFLNDLGRQKKRQQQWEAMGLHADTNVTHGKYDNLQEAIAEEEKEEAAAKRPQAAPDNRKIKYMKGRIVSVNCEATPGATLNVSSGGNTWQLHVIDRNTAVLIGADHFDCSWHNATVSINYKRSGKLQGDLVSLEVD